MTTYSSTYIGTRNPGTYGTGGGEPARQQADYERRAEDSINTTSVTIREVRSRPESDLVALFHRALVSLATVRGQLARDHRTTDATHFGCRRDGAEVIVGDGAHAYTPLHTASYREYGALFLRRLRDVIARLRHDLTAFHETTTSIESRAFDRTSRFSIEVVTGRELEARRWTEPPSSEELTTIVGPPAASPEERMPERIKAKLLLLKTTAPALYEREKMWFYLDLINKAYPSPQRRDPSGRAYVEGSDFSNLKSVYVVATSRLEVGGKLMALSKYLTWMYYDLTEDPVERMVERSKAIIMHQDAFLVEPMLVEITALFARCVSWHPTDEPVAGEFTELKNRVALLSYTFSHAMPFRRGSAAIQEWLRAAIFRSHGLDMTYNRDALADLDALTALSLGDFALVHNRNTTLARRVVA
ncbi:MAG: hypothetical protein JSR76_05115 [Verrucomicrobia bacterium]|nr:hypothetical protein [Verrucomicrobiota bacterium]